jgi:hypothetical protein
MPEEHDLSFLCGRKYALLAKLREEGLSPGELTDLNEVEASIMHALKQEGVGVAEEGWFDFLESRLKAAFKKFT